ncbi:efflux RND transporter permease subunit [Kaarinaea lacus]
MTDTLKLFYKKLILDRPVVTLLLTILFIGFLSLFAGNFKLDASSDSLVLENDKDLRYYQSISAKYGSDDFLVITYTPNEGLYDKSTLDDIQNLKSDLEAIKRVKTVTTILDVPLINSPRITVAQLQKHTPTLLSPETDIKLAEKEFQESPIYSNLLVSKDGKPTAIQVIFKKDETYQSLLTRRNDLRQKRLIETLSPEEKSELDKVSREFKQYSSQLLDKEKSDIATVRAILDKYRDKADIHLGGIPMIVSDMIDYIQHDIDVFGLGVLAFLIILLTLFFRLPRWIILPMVVCFAAVFGMIGFLGMMEWRVTVVSSNFISLLLIITLSLMVHLIVRYREIHAENPDGDQKTLVWDTVRSKFQPAFFTSVTTIVAFGSLLVSGIRPVIDFGWMMVFGVGMGFVLAFLMFPTGLVLLKTGKAIHLRDFTGAITRFFAHTIHHYPRSVIGAYSILFVLSIYGMTMLAVENRFIDYFKESTEIYQGMLTIDQKLGGTTPLDVILDPDQSFYEYQEELKAEQAEEGGFQAEGSVGISGSSYWFNTFQLETVDKIQKYLESLPQTGKVLSMSTTMQMLTQLNNDEPLDDMALAVMYKRIPDSVRKPLFDPYMSADGNQVRFSIRVFESDATLKRQELLDKIRKDLVEKIGLEEQQVHLTGMVVLYNNMLQSLFQSQIMTLGVVFLAIMVMFMILFRSVKISLIAIIPNIVAAVFVLGLMGWLRIPLDMMTITIAAITIGIAVDDTIHYIHRFSEEYPKDYDGWAAVLRCHNSIGRAMYYTSVTITLGFSILALSNFIPTIYFGLLTGLAMIIALLADLMLLPILLVIFKPIKQPN